MAENVWGTSKTIIVCYMNGMRWVPPRKWWRVTNIRQPGLSKQADPVLSKSVGSARKLLEAPCKLL